MGSDPFMSFLVNGLVPILGFFVALVLVLLGVTTEVHSASVGFLKFSFLVYFFGANFYEN